MPAFPTIVPNAISFDFGSLNTSEQPTVGSSPIRFRRSLKATGNSLQLNYVGLSQAQVEEIRTHYSQSDGTHQTFTLPETLWGGYRSASNDSVYRYAESPTEQHMGLYYNVTVSLRILTGWLVQTVLQAPPALEPSAFEYSSFFLTGYAPFRIEAPDASGSPTPTLIFNARGAAG